MNGAPGALQSRDPAYPAGQVESHPLRHKRTVILIELPFFSFCAMMDARTRTRACLRYWMTIGNHADKSVFAEKSKGENTDGIQNNTMR